MTAALLVVLILGVAAAVSWPLGRYLVWAMEPPEVSGWRARFEALLVSVIGARISASRSWKSYATAMLAFSAVAFAISFAVLSLQPSLPLNPDGKGAIAESLVFHTAASFVSNTNLQHYSGEVSLSYFSQLFGLMWLQFVSAATGLAALAAIARGLAGSRALGNFFVDVARATFLVLLPVAAVLAGLLVLGSTPMTLDGAVHATTLEGAEQVIARGPVAAFVAIKQLGTNGGGFFGPNSTHPLENPTFWTNCLSMLAIVLLPMACVWMFGRMVGRWRHAAVVFAVMFLFLVAKIGFAVWFESAPTKAFETLPIEQVANLEGKELRFGSTTGPLWAVLTTSTSNGSVGAMHDSLNPLAGLAALVGMWLNATFGGVGVGMINMLLYIVIAVFVAGMLVGRTPEYLNRRLGAREVTLAVLAMVAHAAFILGGTAVFAVTPWGLDTLNNTGAHGFAEILYELSSASANNGSGFEGLGDNTVAWNVATGLIMLLARFLPIILPLAIVGSLAEKQPTAQTAGTFGTEDATFGLILVATIVIVGALTFAPAAALGPIVEHLQFLP